jgi:hypothetical protein
MKVAPLVREGSDSSGNHGSESCRDVRTQREQECGGTARHGNSKDVTGAEHMLPLLRVSRHALISAFTAKVYRCDPAGLFWSPTRLRDPRDQAALEGGAY